MRQAHLGGDKLFVDYAGDTVPVIVDRLTGQVRPAQIFVAVMGASNFTYAEASWAQGLADWIGAHTRAFATLGGGAQTAGAGQHQEPALAKAGVAVHPTLEAQTSSGQHNDRIGWCQLILG